VLNENLTHLIAAALHISGRQTILQKYKNYPIRDKSLDKNSNKNTITA
jgi:hypothetical protein